MQNANIKELPLENTADDADHIEVDPGSWTSPYGDFPAPQTWPGEGP